MVATQGRGEGGPKVTGMGIQEGEGQRTGVWLCGSGGVALRMVWFID